MNIIMVDTETLQELDQLHKEVQRIHAGWGLGIMVQSERDAERLSETPHPRASEIAADRLGYEPFQLTERS